jgi:hypothetical protein
VQLQIVKQPQRNDVRFERLRLPSILPQLVVAFKKNVFQDV